MSAAAIVHPKLAQASFDRAIRPLLTCTDQYGQLGIHLRSCSYPFLDVDLDWRAHGRVVKLRVDGTDYPYRPVSGYWIDAHGARLLPGEGRVPSGAGLHVGALDGTAGTWFCFKGWREYHDHPSHQDRSWASLRREGKYAIPQLIQELHWVLNNDQGVTPA